MAATRTAKNPTAHNDSPNTPDVREGAIAKMKVAELRQKLRTHGVKDTAELKKPELVQRLIKAEVAATKKGSTAKKSTKSTAAKK
ncbi:SAP domain-containing protein, partial [Actinoplanes auranticolor]|uniref:SAP domain-containing protein n=2 Tax=Actinoplanes auranticolor TaxID=47988 RepID=UPI0034DB626E